MLTVVGVSGDVIHQWFGRRNYPTYFRPYALDPRADFSFAIRTRGGDPENIAQDVRREIAAVDPYQPAYEMWSMRRSLMIGTVGIRFVAAIMTALSGLALMLALSGVYGVMAYRVSLRTLEVGIRRALGATSRDVLRLTMDQAVRLTVTGLAIGALLGIAMGRGLSGLLSGAMSLDVPTVGVTALMIGGAALLAAYVPARRSLSVEPTRALRAE
jgi:ABC-type antimicrobial peptide transport system permease subunit